MSTHSYALLDLSGTVHLQLDLTRHNIHRTMTAGASASARRDLITISAHEWPPVLAAFENLGSEPSNLYNVFAFEKLRVFDLGIICQFCDLTHSVIQRSSNLPLSRLTGIMKYRYTYLPAMAHLHSQQPFRSSNDDTQEGMSGQILIHSPYLWCCIMAVGDERPDDERLLQFALQLVIVSTFTCRNSALTLDSIQKWQRYLFRFGKLLAGIFQVDANTKLHRLMRHVREQITFLGCILRSSTEENETIHK